MMKIDAENYAGKRVCVALSGGMDSVCLLSLLRESLPADLLSAIHVEHGIRGESSLRDMRFCIRLCEDWGIPLTVVRADVPARARLEKRGIEETARAVRYEAFERLLSEGKADVVATAHHREDEAETLLFRLARGTSLAGMRGIGEREGIVRPLLRCSREEIASYVKERGLPHVEDPTNADERYTRNYIRAKVLPAFRGICGNAEEHLLRFAALCREDDAYLGALAAEKVKIRGGEGRVPADLPGPLFFRACMLCTEGGRDLTAAALSEIERLKSLQSGRRVSLPHGYEAAREGEEIVFYRREEYPESPFEGAGSYRGFTVSSGGERGMRVDLDRFPQGCTVRTRREGDFLIPFGGRRKTLKKFFTDRKIPARVGWGIPLIAQGSEILVAVGVEISDRVRISSETVHAGSITWEEMKWNYTRTAR